MPPKDSLWGIFSDYRRHLNDTFHNLDFNEEFNQAFEVLENSHQNVFITGKAGTGKSTLLQYFRQKTSKNVAVLAPTGDRKSVV